MHFKYHYFQMKGSTGESRPLLHCSMFLLLPKQCMHVNIDLQLLTL